MKHKAFFYLAIGIFASLIIMLLKGGSWGFLIATVLLLVTIINPADLLLRTLIARGLFAFLVTIGIYQIESVIFAITHLQVNADVYTCLTFVVVTSLWIYLKLNKPSVLGGFKFSRLDIILALPAIIITGAYTGRILAQQENDNLSIVRSISIASDDIAHLSMFDTLIRSQENLTINKPNDDPSITIGYRDYPMGWHLASAVLTSSIYPNADKETMLHTGIHYFIAKMSSFFLMTLSLTILVWQAALYILRRTDSLFTTLALYVIVAFTTFFITLPQTFEGFFSFYPILIYASLFAAIAIELVKSKVSTSKLLDTLLLFFIIGSAVCWILTAPILLVAYIILKLSVYSKLRSIPVWHYIVVVAGTLAIAYQVLVQLRLHSGGASAIAAEGGITVPDMLLFIATNAALLIYHSRVKTNEVSQALLSILVPLYSVMAVILVYVTFKLQKITYYFEKLEIVALLLLIPIASILLYKAIASKSLIAQKNLNAAYHFILFCTVLVMAIPGVVGYGYFANTLNRVHHPRTLETQDAKVIVNEILNKPYGQSDSRSLFFYPESKPRSIVGSNIARVGYHNTPCDKTLASDAYESVEKLAQDITKCTPTLPTVIIHTNTTGAKEIEAAIPAKYFTNKEVLVSITPN